MTQAKQDLLVISAQKGNRQAFACLYRSLNGPLIRFAYKICLDQEISHEAAQDTWIKVFKNIKQLNDPRAFKAWLFKAVRWRVLDLLRKQTHYAEDSLDETQAELIALNNYEHEELLDIINKLPEIERQAIHLFYLEGLKVSEISEVLEIPTGTVKSRLNRARHFLREKLDV